MGTDRIATYREFWKYYVGEHSQPTTRVLHFVGTSLVLGCAALGAVVSPRFLLAMPVSGYAFAWIGHFAFERNRPATFKYPLWSLLADFQMYGFMLTGRMGHEVEKYAIAREGRVGHLG